MAATRRSKRYRPTLITEKLVPVILVVLLIVLLVVFAIIGLSLVGVFPPA